MVFLVLVGCAKQLDDDPFFNSSDRYDPPDWSQSDSGETGDTGDDTAGGDAGAPVLSNVSLTWEEYPNVGMVLFFSALYTDDGDDIVSGTCYVDVYNDAEYITSLTLEVTDSPDGESNQCFAIDGTLFFAIEDLDDSKSGGVTVEVKDGSGNVSSTYEATTPE